MNTPGRSSPTKLFKFNPTNLLSLIFTDFFATLDEFMNRKESILQISIEKLIHVDTLAIQLYINMCYDQ